MIVILKILKELIFHNLLIYFISVFHFLQAVYHPQNHYCIQPDADSSLEFQEGIKGLGFLFITSSTSLSLFKKDIWTYIFKIIIFLLLSQQVPKTRSLKGENPLKGELKDFAT